MTWTSFTSYATGWQFDTDLRAIKRNTEANQITVNTLYSAIMAEFDDAEEMDDTVPMSATTPTEYKLINGWFIDDDSMAYLKGGSIETVGWDPSVYTNGIYNLVMSASGYTNCVAGDIGKTVTDGTRTGTLLAYNNTTRKWWVRRGTGTAWTGSITITGGTGAGTLSSNLYGEDLWANFYNLGTLKSGGILYVEQNGVLIPSPPGYTSGDMDLLVRVVQNSAQINSRKVSMFSRDLGDRYDNFEIAAPSTGGRNPIPISTEDDVSDDASGGSVAGVTINFGSVNKDIGDGGGSQPYYWTVDGGGNTSLQVYRRLKYLTRRENTSALDSPDNNTEGRFYLAAQSSYSQVKSSPFGTYAGGKFFGARGVWLENISDMNNRVLIDNNGVTRTPPTSIYVTVTGVVSGDRVLVARSTSGVINKSQFTLNGAHNGGTSIVVNETVGTDISDGDGTTTTIRVGDTRYIYSSVNRGTKTFTVTTTVGSHANGSPTYVPLIDNVASSTSIQSASMIYSSDFEVVARVRKKGIVPFENVATVTSAGAAVSAIRTTDSIVTP